MEIKGAGVLKNKKNDALFNAIAPIYALFYNYQKKFFSKVIDGAKSEFDPTLYKTVLDVGCGTGALCSVLQGKGMKVTGIDSAKKMIASAKKNPENNGVSFIQADVGAGLPFPDKSFDIAIASYVAHGINAPERTVLYAEMGRIARHAVIIYDYNQKHSLMTTIVEYLERGDYFNFIKLAETEMIECIMQNNKCFSNVRVVNVDLRAAWYICTPVNPS